MIEEDKCSEVFNSTMGSRPFVSCVQMFCQAVGEAL